MIEDTKINEPGLDESSQVDVKAEIISWVKFILAAVVCAFLINSFILFNAYVPTASMENTIMTGDRVLGLRLSYTFGKPERYDVAIFIFPDSERAGQKKEYYVKRVMGLPGETLEIKDGEIYINNTVVPLSDNFVKEPPFEENWGPYEIPEGTYFMLGDNRNRSVDSRFWINTFVKEEKVLAKAYVCMWPNPRLIK